MHKVVRYASERKEWEKIMKMEAELDANDGAGKYVDEEYSIQATTSLWIYLYRCAKLGSRSLWKKNRNFVLEEQVRALCDKVIQHRLTTTQSGENILHRKTNIPMRPDVITCFCNMTDVIIDTNPTLYSDIALKLNITFNEERLLCKAFSDFAEVLFSKGTTWPLVVSFLAFSSSLAVECAKHRRSILVRRISDWATIFIVMRLREWIVENGRWNGVLRYFEPKKQPSSMFSPKQMIEDLKRKYQNNERVIWVVLSVIFGTLVFYFFQCFGLYIFYALI